MSLLASLALVDEEGRVLPPSNPGLPCIWRAPRAWLEGGRWLAYEGAEQADEIIDQAEQILFSVSQRRLTHSLTPIREVLDRYYDRIEYLHQHQGETVGLPTGFIDLDRLLGGLEKS